MMSSMLRVLSVALAVLVSVAPVYGQDAFESQILIKNVRIFDGVNEELLQGNVLVFGNLISEISAEAIVAPGATVIDGDGRTPDMLELGYGTAPQV